MKTHQKESINELLELMNKVNFFKTLKSEKECFIAELKVPNYTELNMMISCLLKASILMLQNENFGKAFSEPMILVEIALQLLPNDEMELLDKICKLNLESEDFNVS